MGAMTGQLYQLDEDFETGLRQAVQNNQQTLAFQYLLRKLEEQDAKIKELEQKLSTPTSAPAKKTAAKKTTKKTTEDE